MREILFRGKETETRKWYYGGFFPHKHTTYCFKEDYDAHPENDAPCIVFDEMTDWGLPNRAKLATVIPETISQYIGLNDKNGEKIFEGDILKFCHSNYLKNRDEIVRVEWMEQKAMFCIRDALGFAFHLSSANEKFYQIIGNIWDNPELLKEEQHEIN